MWWGDLRGIRYDAAGSHPDPGFADKCRRAYDGNTVVTNREQNRAGKIWYFYEIIAPASVEGMNLSDHTSFHKNGFPSLLLTDTGFYRSRNYHSEQDTEATINYRFLAANIKNIFHTLKDIANRKELP